MTDTDAAHDEGREAALSGKSFSDNPYSMAQGSPDRPRGFAWRKGFQAGERDEGEALGHFRDVAQ